MRVLFAIALAAALMFAFGCAGQEQKSQDGSTGPQGQVGPASSATDGTDVTAQNRMGYDQTQEAIELAVADGTYSSIAGYDYHSGHEDVEINVTVENDVIQAVSVTAIDPHPVSENIIGKFNAALPELVVGRKITELDLPANVAGSSLTNAAFQAHIRDLIEKY